MPYVWSFDGEEVPNVEGVQRGGPTNKHNEWAYPGVDGVDSVSHGFRGETITLQCWGVTQTAEQDVEAFREKMRRGTVGRLTSTRPGFVDLDHARLDNVAQGALRGGDDTFQLQRFTLTFKVIKEND